jgi:thiamine transport system ATP-binding protein
MLQVNEATIRFGTTTAVDGADLAVADGEVLALLGPSGSGKTTLLRAVAGLQALDRGSIGWDGEDLGPVPAHRRGFGLVFQDFALFPHLDVGDNVAFGLKMQGIARSERAAAASEALGRVDLAGFERRKVSSLSGGQQQRVALARALAAGPRMLLLDEPLGSLDRALREHLAGDLRQVLARPGITALYVTHDQSEAFTVADRITIIDHGRIVQRGTPEEVWRRPADEFVARFLGFRTVIDATVVGGRLEAGPLGSFPAPAGPTGSVRVVVRPDAVRVDPAGQVEAVVTSVAFRGVHSVVGLDVGDLEVEAHERRPPAPGDRVRLQIDPAELTILPAS